MSEVRGWVVTYRPAPRKPITVWAVVEDVPADVTRDGVVEALEAWPRWAQYQARTGIRGVITVAKLNGVHASKAAERAERVTWGELRPPVKKLGIEVDGLLWAAIHRAARASGFTLAEWCRRELAASAAFAGFWHGEALAEERPRGFEDVPLPLPLEGEVTA